MFNLQEESLIGDADADRRLVVVLTLQQAVGILGLDGNLRYGIVVHAKGHTLYLGIVVGRILSIAGVGVVLFVTPEDVEFLIIVTQTTYLRENIVASLNAYGVSVLADKGRMMIRRLLVSAVIYILQLFGIAQIAIVGLT